MAENRTGSALMKSVLPTFHLLIAFLPLLWLQYSDGELGRTLEGIGTLNGIILFIALWGTTFWATRRALRMAAPFASGSETTVGPSQVSAVWGGVNGMMFFGAIILLVLINTFGGLRDEFGSPSQLALYGAFLAAGTIAAAIVGATLGFMLSVIDRLVLWGAQKVVAWSVAE